MDKTLFVRLRITGKKCFIFPIRAAAWQSFNARPKGFDDWAVLAQQAGFDGAELDASAYLPLQPTRPLLDIVQDIIAVWGPERVGVQLGPFAWMGRLEDLQWASFYCQLIDVLVEMEVAYIHIAGAYTSERGDLSSVPARPASSPRISGNADGVWRLYAGWRRRGGGAASLGGEPTVIGDCRSTVVGRRK